MSKISTNRAKRFNGSDHGNSMVAACQCLIIAHLVPAANTHLSHTAYVIRIGIFSLGTFTLSGRAQKESFNTSVDLSLYANL